VNKGELLLSAAKNSSSSFRCASLERFLERKGKTNIVREKKILLLDDNKDLLLIVQIILKGQGYEVVQACCVDEAMQKIRIHQPSLIMMDVFIKDEDGRELCSQLKSDPDTSSIKIILMSGIESENDNLQAIGADDFIPKPFDYDDLLERVNRQMSGVEA
jgi:two-component system, OmpR family, response regulator VicR